MIHHHFSKQNATRHYLNTNVLKHICGTSRFIFLNNSRIRSYHNFKNGTTSINFFLYNHMSSKKRKISNTIHNYNFKWHKTLFTQKQKKMSEPKPKSTYQNNKQSQIRTMHYPNNKKFPYFTVSIILGMFGVTFFFKFLIYNLKHCNNENEIILQVDKILNYLDKYFILCNSDNNNNCIDNTMHKNPFINLNNIFNIKYLTSPFFIDENLLKSIVQLSTFFLASCFLEKQYGSLIYSGLFLSGTLFSNIITFYFLKYLKKIESYNSVQFVLIHPSGSMAFICALCSMYFKNSVIWKNIPIHCSIFIVPFLFSSFYGLLSLYKIKKKHMLTTDQNENNTTNVLENKMSDDSKFTLKKNDTINNTTYDTINNTTYDTINNTTYDTINNTADNITDNTIDNNEKEQIKDIYDKNDSNGNNNSDSYISNSSSSSNNNNIFIQYDKNKALNTLKNFLIVEACDSVTKKKKNENIFLNKKIKNLKKEALTNIKEINNKSEKTFFGLTSSFTDFFSIILASTFYFFKFLK
ncbi:conserved membrane protein, unknown function [Hepatocystis sp. ex Piliocolobus tephrosceles]|nr:conserved membrane protein, unknown function [Hepatocystis sp. ex Piliocolobus tephrosceles]